jgi:hypothetical protein
MKVPDITGQRFGRLLVLEYAGFHKTRRGKRQVKCLCDCGNETVTCQWDLQAGTTTSCGCYVKSLLRNSVRNYKVINEALASRWESLQEMAEGRPHLSAILKDLEERFPINV